jgi:hypothetical protein
MKNAANEVGALFAVSAYGIRRYAGGIFAAGDTFFVYANKKR